MIQANEYMIQINEFMIQVIEYIYVSMFLKSELRATSNSAGF